MKDEKILLSEEAKKQHYLYTLEKLEDSKNNISKEFDKLTGLLNRKAFYHYGYDLINNNKSKRYALILFDIYKFKTVNEFFGRDIGDELLLYIGDIFKSYEGKDCIASHLRADTFAMITRFSSRDDLVTIASNISEKLMEYHLQCKIMPSMGIFISETNDEPVNIMCDYAKMALETIKGKVFTTYAFYNESYRRKLLDDKRIENEMVTALRNGQFDIYIQPKVNITTNEVVGGEVLVRWLHPEDGLMYPKQFIPIFEQNGFVVDLDIYLWEKVFKLIRKWLDEGKKVVPLSINLSRVHVNNLIFEDKLYYFSEKYQVSPKYIKIELTESAFVENEETIFDIMNRMRNSGYSFSIDDFGTGYSAMALLKKEPIDEVKIDKEFLDDYKGNDKVEIVLKHMIAMLKELGVDVIAEGVETMEQSDILKRCGCDVVQGFAYYRALPTDEFEKLIN